MSISTELRSFVVVFHDGSYKYINKDFAEKIFEASTSGLENIEIAGSLYKFSAVAKIISYQEFELEYPNKIKKERKSISPSEYYTYPEGVPEMKISDYNSDRARQGMIKGLKDYIANNETTGKAEALLESLEKGRLDLSVIG